MKDKPITIKTLRKKCRKWQSILDLSNWAISIGYGDIKEIGEKDVGTVQCDYETRKATIRILDKYNECEKYGTFYNIDTIIIHELIHVLLWEKSDNLPIELTRKRVFSELEEYVCDKFAEIIFGCMNKKKSNLPKI